MKKPISWLLVLTFLFPVGNRIQAAKGTGNYPALREAFTQEKWDDVLRRIDRDMGSVPPEEQHFLTLLQALAYSQKRDWNQVIKSANAVKAKSNLWDEYADLLIADARFGLGQFKQSRQSIEQIGKEKPNLKINTDSQLLLGKVALSEGRFDEAKRVLTKTEKSVRGQTTHPTVIWQIARAEKGLKNHTAYCSRLLRLYRDFPDFEMTATWGPFLDENKFEGQASLCSFSWVDSLVRTKNLLLVGQVDRAQREIQLIADRSQGQKSFEIDRLRAQFLIHEGEVSKALELLSPYFQQKKTDLSYLAIVASAANRAGDSATAIGTYLMMYKLAPHSVPGWQSLFQAAFLSYQFQDYDGATRRFREFLQRHPGSRLALDAEWHLSWISYLKGQFDLAYEGFGKLRDKIQGRGQHKARSQIVDRIEYWMGMCQFRQKNYGLARSLFAEISHRGQEGSYYTIVANQRLKQVEQLSPSAQPVQAQTLGHWVSGGVRGPASIFARPYLAPPDDFHSWAQNVPVSEDAEEKVVIRDDIETAVDNVSDETESALIDNTMLSGEDEYAQNLSSSPNPLIVQRFERARRFISVGLFEWAKWELYEIERKTSNKDYLRALMAEYERIGNFHRSAQIAGNQFAKARVEGGIANQKSLWEKAYPKAYLDHVSEFSQKFGIPPEMIWSIMRAETNFRKDAMSPVGALGLMQVMPKTGQKLADLMGEKAFEARKLLEPPMAIKMGSKYLQRLWRKFDGNRALVAGGYNAGPHRILLWLNRFGNLDLDEFIEHIPYVETRNYIKRVVSNYQLYARIYDNQDDIFPELSQPIMMKVKDPVPDKETWEDI